MEEEAKCLYGTNFSYAERDFFTNKLLKVTPNISQEVVNQSIAFLERQKEANCPYTIHTQKRGHEWIVFNRLPDRIPYNHNDGSQMSDSDTVGFSDTEDNAENEESKVADTTSGNEDMEEEDNRNNQDSTDASGASSENFTSS